MKIKSSLIERLRILVLCIQLTLLFGQNVVALPIPLRSNHIHELYSVFKGICPSLATITNNVIIQPQVSSVCSGFSFKPASINGSQAIPTAGTTYIWQKSADLGVTWSDIGGATLQNYDPSLLTTTTWFRRIAKNGSDQVESNIVRIVIASQPVSNYNISSLDQAIVSGATPQMLIGESPKGGDGKSYEYTWQYCTDAVNWVDAPGVNDLRDYQPPAVFVKTFFQRRVKMGDCPVSTSNVVTISIVPITVSNNTIIQPLDNESCSQPSFDPGIIGGSTPTVTQGVSFIYQWQQSTNGSSYSDIVGATNVSYDPPGLTKTTLFKRKVLAGNITSESNVATIIVNPQGISDNTINSVPDVKAGVQPNVIIGSDPSPAGSFFEFTWEISYDGSTGWVAAPGANSDKNYQPQPLTKTTYFRRKVGSGKCSAIVSTAIKITVLPSGAISNNKITAPATTSFCGLAVVDPGVISGTAATNALTYQWQQSFNNSTWSNITDATAQNYDPNNLTQKIYFRRIAMAGITKDTSNVVPFLITPITIDKNTITSAPQIVLSGSTPAIIAGAQPTGGDGTYTYLWEQSEGGQNNWVSAAGVNNQLNYQSPALSAPVYYRRTVTSGACSSTSEKYLVSIITATDLAIEKTGGISDELEQAVQFVIKAKNKGAQVANTVLITDTLANNIEYISSRSDVGVIEYDPIKRIIKWQLDKLRSDKEVSLKIQAKPLELFNLVNKAYITGPVVDDDLSNNSSQAVIREVVFAIDKETVPNMITPNGDGKNDVFKISGIFSFSNELTILDRYGNRVFYVENYQNDWNGEGLSEGTYFYVLKLMVGSKPKVYQGFITLMRSRISS